MIIYDADKVREARVHDLRRCIIDYIMTWASELLDNNIEGSNLMYQRLKEAERQLHGK